MGECAPKDMEPPLASTADPGLMAEPITSLLYQGSCPGSFCQSSTFHELCPCPAAIYQCDHLHSLGMLLSHTGSRVWYLGLRVQNVLSTSTGSIGLSRMVRGSVQLHVAS